MVGYFLFLKRNLVVAATNELQRKASPAEEENKAVILDMKVNILEIYEVRVYQSVVNDDIYIERAELQGENVQKSGVQVEDNKFLLRRQSL